MRRRLPPGYIANFDSASAMVRSTARFLKGKDFPSLGLGRLLKAVVPLANQLAKTPREVQYAVGGWGEALSPGRLHQVRAEHVAEWVVGLYPERKYPAALIGSASGAPVHLSAALGVPWLPQTFLIPVSQMGVHPDDAGEGLDAAIEPARRLLEANPELQLHHMHDPNNQDRLMLYLIDVLPGEVAQAEWGFEAALRDDIEAFAEANRYHVWRIVFQEPEHLSPLVADLYRDRQGDRYPVEWTTRERVMI